MQHDQERLQTMIAWSSSIEIGRPIEVVFEFLANIHDVQQEEGSPVLTLDLITPDPPRKGSQYREVVQMMPFVKGEILSEITVFEPPYVLEMAWKGPGMTGVDRYVLERMHEGAQLTHTKDTSFKGVLGLFEPFMRIPLIPRLEQRLDEIRYFLEKGQEQQQERTN
jgi:hypothetical protein